MCVICAIDKIKQELGSQLSEYLIDDLMDIVDSYIGLSDYYVQIQSCKIVKDIRGYLASSVECLNIIDCPNIETLSPLPDLISLEIYKCPKINTLPEFPKLIMLHTDNKKHNRPSTVMMGS